MQRNYKQGLGTNHYRHEKELEGITMKKILLGLALISSFATYTSEGSFDREDISQAVKNTPCHILKMELPTLVFSSRALFQSKGEIDEDGREINLDNPRVELAIHTMQVALERAAECIDAL